MLTPFANSFGTIAIGSGADNVNGIRRIFPATPVDAQTFGSELLGLANAVIWVIMDTLTSSGNREHGKG